MRDFFKKAEKWILWFFVLLMGGSLVLSWGPGMGGGGREEEKKAAAKATINDSEVSFSEADVQHGFELAHSFEGISLAMAMASWGRDKSLTPEMRTALRGLILPPNAVTIDPYRRTQTTRKNALDVLVLQEYTKSSGVKVPTGQAEIVYSTLLKSWNASFGQEKKVEEPEKDFHERLTVKTRSDAVKMIDQYLAIGYFLSTLTNPSMSSVESEVNSFISEQEDSIRYEYAILNPDVIGTVSPITDTEVYRCLELSLVDPAKMGNIRPDQSTSQLLSTLRNAIGSAYMYQLTYFACPFSEFASKAPKPTDETLKSFFDAHKDEFKDKNKADGPEPDFTALKEQVTQKWKEAQPEVHRDTLETIRSFRTEIRKDLARYPGKEKDYFLQISEKVKARANFARIKVPDLTPVFMNADELEETWGKVKEEKNLNDFLKSSSVGDYASFDVETDKGYYVVQMTKKRQVSPEMIRDAVAGLISREVQKNRLKGIAEKVKKALNDARAQDPSKRLDDTIHEAGYPGDFSVYSTDFLKSDETYDDEVLSNLSRKNHNPNERDYFPIESGSRIVVFRQMERRAEKIDGTKLKEHLGGEHILPQGGEGRVVQTLLSDAKINDLSGSGRDERE